MDLATTYFFPTVIILLLIISGLYFLMKKWVNGIFFIFMGVSLGVGEVISKAITGGTISRAHWEIGVTNPEISNLISLMILGLFLVIFVHLASTAYRKFVTKERKDK